MGRHVHAVYSSVLIWLDRKCRFSSFPSVASEAVSGPYRRSVPGAPCAYSLAAAAAGESAAEDSCPCACEGMLGG